VTTVLVTGATGFVGSHVVRDQVEHGFAVHALVRPGSDERRLADLAGEYSTVVADLRDRDEVFSAVRTVAPDRVLHLGAAAMHAGRSPDATELVTTNLTGTVSLLDACRDEGVDAFVNVGDAFEYGPGTGALAEDAPCRPSSLDGITKLAANHYAAVAADGGLPVVSVRPFSIVGRDDDPRRLVPRLLGTARTGGRMPLSDRRVVRDFVAVADVVDLLTRAAGAARRLRGRTFNCGRGEATSLGEVVTTVEAVSGRALDAEWGAFPVAEHDLDHPFADIRAAAAALDWCPTTSLAEMVEQLWSAG
jgi:UDP-glucose 4-epimerase